MKYEMEAGWDEIVRIWVFLCLFRILCQSSLRVGPSPPWLIPAVSRSLDHHLCIYAHLCFLFAVRSLSILSVVFKSSPVTTSVSCSLCSPVLSELRFSSLNHHCLRFCLGLPLFSSPATPHFMTKMPMCGYIMEISNWLEESQVTKTKRVTTSSSLCWS